MESIVHILKKNFFKETPIPDPEAPPHEYDLIIDRNKYSKNPDHAYNQALSRRLEALNFPDRVPFLEYQAGLSEDPVMWLSRLAGLLNALSLNDFFTMQDSVNHYFHIINELIKRAKIEAAAALEGLKSEKPTWNGSPDTFFTLAATLYEMRFIYMDLYGQDQAKVAEAFFNFIQIGTIRKGGKPYSKASFMQNFKPSVQNEKRKKDEKLRAKHKLTVEYLEAMRRLDRE